ncbi:hypothetical protein ACFQPA_00930 [Halomarina halobia]|uniref:Uncharacterized protein n=1 Tax=Halomarina halobia TaxID=3033386 RepID=A0ABD6A7N2_9EURY|nr:hypothetical protein [Halomarina sp. PSR21]
MSTEQRDADGPEIEFLQLSDFRIKLTTDDDAWIISDKWYDLDAKR